MIDRLGFRIGAVATLGASVLAGCSGGQNTASVVPATATNPSTAAKLVKAQVNLRIPIRKVVGTSSRRTPKYVSVGTNGIEIVVTGPGQTNGTPQLFDVSATSTASPNPCTVSGGFRNCTLTVTAPAVDGGSDSFAVTATDAAPAAGAMQGNILSTGYTTAVVVAGAANPIGIQLTGVIGQLVVAKTASVWAAPGQTGTVSGSTIVNITANDFTGANIAGAQPTFTNPIMFADNTVGTSPFTYPSADIATGFYGLQAPATPGPIPATISYSAPTTATPITTTVTVSTNVPTFLPTPVAPLLPYPTATFTLNTMVVSVAGAPVASVPGLAVGNDVTVTVAELGASTFTVSAPNNDGSFTLLSGQGVTLAAPASPSTGSTIAADKTGTATFTVHPVSVTPSADAPTITITDANGTTATLAAVVGPATAAPAVTTP
jgi:hypothetical protein